jgi:hypothetical protein
VAAPVAFNTANGVLSLTTGTDFAGGMYTITAKYTINGNTFTTRQQVYVQACQNRKVGRISEWQSGARLTGSGTVYIYQ